MKKALIISGALLLTGYLVWHFKNQLGLLKKTCIQFNGYVMNELNYQRIAFDVFLKVLNRSDIALTISSYDFDVLINNTFITKLKSNVPRIIDRDGATDLKLSIEISPQKILANTALVSGLLLNYNNAVVTIKGQITADAGGISGSNIPIMAESKLKDMVPISGKKEVSDCV